MSLEFKLYLKYISHSRSIFVCVRGRRVGLAQVDGWQSVSQQGQAGWKNSPYHWSQHWHWERDGPGPGLSRWDHLIRNKMAFGGVTTLTLVIWCWPITKMYAHHLGGWSSLWTWGSFFHHCSLWNVVLLTHQPLWIRVAMQFELQLLPK